MTITAPSTVTGFAFVSYLYIILLIVVRLVLPTVALILLIKALLKYLHTGEIRREKSVVRKSLGEALKENRIRCQMTQEFVAEHLGVSRQAVSKWENGTSDPPPPICWLWPNSTALIPLTCSGR